ncbi:MAG: WxcM-like domain-containing protein [Elusimicrobiota bacterium]
MDYKITFCDKHSDLRGYLVEFLKQTELMEEHKQFGQIYFVTFEKPETVRGNHYHLSTYEWFGVASGILEVVLEDVNTKERLTFKLDSNDKKFVRLHIGLNVAHAFKNLSDTAVLIDYANRPYDPQNTDRHFYELIPAGDK